MQRRQSSLPQLPQGRPLLWAGCPRGILPWVRTVFKSQDPNLASVEGRCCLLMLTLRLVWGSGADPASLIGEPVRWWRPAPPHKAVLCRPVSGGLGWG